MAEQFSSQITWAAGEITPRLWQRKDLAQNSAGSKSLKNCFIWRQGGTFRRQGTIFVDTATGAGILIGFVYSSQVGYLILLTDQLATVYRDGAKVVTFSTPWTEAQLKGLYWTQSFDVLFVAHEEHQPQVIKRFGDTNWTIENFDYRTNDNFIEQPYWKFANTNAELTAGALTGTTTLVSSEDLFDPLHVGVRFRLHGGEVEVTAVTDARNADIEVKEDLDKITATKDWDEQAFSNYRGYPSVVKIHDQRLVFAGNVQIPNTLWFSEIGDLYSFLPKDRDPDSDTTGDVLATNAITVTLDSNPGRIVWAESVGTRFIVGTTDGESGIEPASVNDGLAPDNITAVNYSRWGSVSRGGAVRVGKDVLHIQRGGWTLRRLSYELDDDDIDSNIITDSNEHLVKGGDRIYFQTTPEQAAWLQRRDNSLSRMTYEPKQKVAAWTPIDLSAPVHSIAVLPEPDGTDEVYFLVFRNGAYRVEKLSEPTDDPLQTPYLDSALYGHSDNGLSTWTGLAHLEGMTVGVWADGFNHPDVVVTDGSITLKNAYKDIWVGIRYRHEIDFIPPNKENLSMKAQLKRLLLYLLDSKSRELHAVANGTDELYAPLQEQGSTLAEIPWNGSTERDLGQIFLYSDEPYPFNLTAATFIWEVNPE